DPQRDRGGSQHQEARDQVVAQPRRQAGARDGLVRHSSPSFVVPCAPPPSFDCRGNRVNIHLRRPKAGTLGPKPSNPSPTREPEGSPHPPPPPGKRTPPRPPPPPHSVVRRTTRRTYRSVLPCRDLAPHGTRTVFAS